MVWPGLPGQVLVRPLSVRLLDELSVPALAAFSFTRKLRGAYEGAATEVRETGGGTLENIGFDAALNMDQVALVDHIGVNDGRCRSLYDQGVNGFNYIQTTDADQLLVASAGSVIMQNGVPTGRFNALGEHLEGGAFGLEGTDPALTVAWVYKHTESDATAGYLFFLGPASGGSLDVLAIQYDEDVSPWDISWRFYGANRIFNGSIAQMSQHMLLADRAAGAQVQNHEIAIAGAALTQKSVSNPTSTITLDAASISQLGGDVIAGAGYVRGDLQELLIFEAVLSAGDKAIIRANWQDYYGVS